MKHLREFSEWNPDEWDERSLDALDKSLISLGFDGPVKYVFKLVYVADYENIIPVSETPEEEDVIYHGMVIKLDLETPEVTRENDMNVADAISQLMDEAGEPMRADKIRSLKGGKEFRPRKIEAGHSESAGYESLISLYSMLDGMLRSNQPLLSVTEAERCDPLFIYAENGASRDIVPGEEAGGDLRKAYWNDIGGRGESKDFDKMVDSLSKGALVDKFAYENEEDGAFLSYRENTWDGTCWVTIERIDFESGNKLAVFDFEFSLLA